MTAITKAWVDIADGAVDPDSPLDTTLLTALRDNHIHVREWLGASYTGGAIQDHDHDGVNSARVPVGPNMLRNGSFESGENGWTFVDFTGGSHAVSASTRHHGALAISFTSTVLANGGGTAESNEFVPCGGSVEHLFDLWRSASAANISAKAEVEWFDANQAPISNSTIVTSTSTPTSATRTRIMIASPATARFFKILLTGGIPASGAATGTIYFDGINVSDWAVNGSHIEDNTITQLNIGADAVGQSELKTTTASGTTSVTAGTSTTVTLTGGTHAWVTWGADDPSGAAHGVHFGFGNTAAGVLGLYNSDSVNKSFYRDERYVQASPPYTHGPTFVFLLLDAAGAIVNVEVGFDPPWAYHGPTDIRAQRRTRDGRAFRRIAVYDGHTLREALASKDDTLIRSIVRGELQREVVEREITLAYKDSDRDLVPHPWSFNRADYFTGRTVVMLEPGTTLMGKLEEIAVASHAREVKDLILRGYLNLGKEPIDLPTRPAGVIVAPASWKLTR